MLESSRAGSWCDLRRSCRQDWRFWFLRFLAESFVDLASRVLILHLFVAYGEGLRIWHGKGNRMERQALEHICERAGLDVYICIQVGHGTVLKS